MNSVQTIPRMEGNVLHPNPFHYGRRYVNWENQRTSAWPRTKAIGLARSFVNASETERGMIFDTNFILQELDNDENGFHRYVFFDGQQRLTTTTLVALALLRLYRDSQVDTQNSAGTAGLSQVSADALLRLHPASSITGERFGGEPHTGGIYSYVDENGGFRPWLSISRGVNEDHFDEFIANLVFTSRITLVETADRSLREELRSPEARLANNFLGILDYLSSLRLDDERFVAIVNAVADFRCYYNIYRDTDEATRAFTNSNNGAQMSFAGVMRVIVAGIYGDKELTETLNKLDTKAVYGFLPKSVAEVQDKNGSDLIYRLAFSSTMLEPIHAGDDNAADTKQFKSEIPTAKEATRFFNSIVELVESMRSMESGDVRGKRKPPKGKRQTRQHLFSQFLYLIATQGNDRSAWYAAFYLLRKLDKVGVQQLREVLDAFTRLYINVTLFGSVDPAREDDRSFYRLVRSTVEKLGVENLNRSSLDSYFAGLAGPWRPNTKAKLRAHLEQVSFEPAAMSVFGQLYPAATAYADTARAIRSKRTIPELLYNYQRSSFTVPSKDCLAPVVAVSDEHSTLIRAGGSLALAYPGSYLVTHYKLDVNRDDSQQIATLLNRTVGGTRIGDSESLAIIAEKLENFNDGFTRGHVAPEFVSATRSWQAARLADAYGIDTAPFEKLQSRLSQRFPSATQVYMVAGDDCFSFDLSLGRLSVADTALQLEDWGAALELTDFKTQEEMLAVTSIFVGEDEHDEKLAEVLAG